VLCELSQEEAVLWDAFISADTELRGTMHVHGPELKDMVLQLVQQEDRVASQVEAIAKWADENDEVDFADLLDCFDANKLQGIVWPLQTSLRKSLSQLLGSDDQDNSRRVRMRPELITLLRGRLASMAPPTLAKAAHTSQRTLILIAWSQCERRLISIVTTAMSPKMQSSGPPPRPVAALLSVLRGINAELAPTERVLWELLGAKDANFEGSNSKSEVLAAVGELLVFSIERELGTKEDEFEELQKLRADCRRRSVEILFENKQNNRVNLADVLRWWWNLSEEYRIAAGLSVPASLLRRSFYRKPEEMFREKLPRMATDSAAAGTALKGHVRAFAELKALAVNRSLENLHGHNSPTGTWTTTSVASEITSEAQSRADPMEDDCGDEDDDKEAAEDQSTDFPHAAGDLPGSKTSTSEGEVVEDGNAKNKVNTTENEDPARRHRRSESSRSPQPEGGLNLSESDGFV
jgi:hypothetical protein